MKIVVILNGISLQKKFFYHDVLPRLTSSFQVEVFETLSRNDAVTLASKAVERQADIILAAGGDGTVFQVLNGMLQGRERHHDLPAMGIIPIGSGNDFARSVNASSNPDALHNALKKNQTANLDVGKVSYINDDGLLEEKFFLNVVDIGMGPEVVKRVLKSDRPFGSAVAYYQNIIATFFTYKPKLIKAQAADWQWENKMRTFAVANGKYYGHGLCIAPDAETDDEMFSVFAVADVSVLDFILQSVPLKKGKRLNHPKVSYFTAKEVELSASTRCSIEADGELLGWLPARVEFAPLKIKFLV